MNETNIEKSGAMAPSGQARWVSSPPRGICVRLSESDQSRLLPEPPHPFTNSWILPSNRAQKLLVLKSHPWALRCDSAAEADATSRGCLARCMALAS